MSEEVRKLLEIAKKILVRDDYYDLHNDFIHNSDCPLCFIVKALALLRDKPTCETCGDSGKVPNPTYGLLTKTKTDIIREIPCPDCKPQESKPVDAGELVKELRSNAATYPDTLVCRRFLKAADLLSQQAQQIVELREQLKKK